MPRQHGPARCATCVDVPPLPRPGTRLAGHDAQPGADRPAARSTTLDLDELRPREDLLGRRRIRRCAPTARGSARRDLRGAAGRDAPLRSPSTSECFAEDELRRASQRPQPGLPAAMSGASPGRRARVSPPSSRARSRPASVRRARVPVRARQVRPVPASAHGRSPATLGGDHAPTMRSRSSRTCSSALQRRPGQRGRGPRRAEAYRLPGPGHGAGVACRDGTRGRTTRCRGRPAASGPRVNPYFVRLYRDVAGRARRPDGARAHRPGAPEDPRGAGGGRSATAKLRLLYCSPTMELGVDIAELNASACATSRRRRRTTRSAPGARAGPASPRW